MVFVKVRETYDLHTTKNKMTVIAIHTPKPDIIKKNYPGLLMQCRAYRPVSCDVRIACASVLPLDPSGVGTADGDVAPEDIFNPILYKAISNKGMSQLEARINAMSHANLGLDVSGFSADVEVDSFTNIADEFPLYYGLLSQTHEWKHANPQSGLSMTNLRPLVYEMVYNVGDSTPKSPDAYLGDVYAHPGADGYANLASVSRILGKAKEFPFLNCTAYSITASKFANFAESGFPNGTSPANCEIDVPYVNVVCGAVIVPPSRLHELFYRMVVEWTIEFSALRPIGEITDWVALAKLGTDTHFQNYSYEETKKALTGDSNSIMDKDSCMVSANVDVDKVM